MLKRFIGKVALTFGKMFRKSEDLDRPDTIEMKSLKAIETMCLRLSFFRYFSAKIQINLPPFLGSLVERTSSSHLHWLHTF